MEELHSQGKTIEDTVEVLKRVPIHPRIVPAIISVHALGCDLRIASDANTFSIETILKHVGLREINTNPSFVDEEGKLRIFPYVDFRNSPHGCTDLCPSNMCKGQIIERIQASLAKEGKKKKKIIYIGDGTGDYAMPRKNFPIWELIYNNRDNVKAEIHEWSDGEELERVLLQLIEESSINLTAQLFSADCKFQTIAVSGHEALP